MEHFHSLRDFTRNTVDKMVVPEVKAQQIADVVLSNKSLPLFRGATCQVFKIDNWPFAELECTDGSVIACSAVGRPVAIKALKKRDPSQTDEEVKQNLRRQVHGEVCAQAFPGCWPSLYQFHGHVNWDGKQVLLCGLVMEAADSSLEDAMLNNLHNLLNGTLAAGSLRVLEHICDINTAGIAHNNIKPGNLVIGKGTWWVIDYGSAEDKEVLDGLQKSFGQARTSHTKRFASQRVMSGHFDGKADLFSFGRTMLEVACFMRGADFDTIARADPRQLAVQLLFEEVRQRPFVEAVMPPILCRLLVWILLLFTFQAGPQGNPFQLEALTHQKARQLYTKWAELVAAWMDNSLNFGGDASVAKLAGLVEELEGLTLAAQDAPEEDKLLQHMLLNWCNLAGDTVTLATLLKWRRNVLESRKASVQGGDNSATLIAKRAEHLDIFSDQVDAGLAAPLLDGQGHMLRRPQLQREQENAAAGHAAAAAGPLKAVPALPQPAAVGKDGGLSSHGKAAAADENVGQNRVHPRGTPAARAPLHQTGNDSLPGSQAAPAVQQEQRASMPWLPLQQRLTAGAGAAAGGCSLSYADFARQHTAVVSPAAVQKLLPADVVVHDRKLGCRVLLAAEEPAGAEDDTWQAPSMQGPRSSIAIALFNAGTAAMAIGIHNGTLAQSAATLLVEDSSGASWAVDMYMAIDFNRGQPVRHLYFSNSQLAAMGHSEAALQAWDELMAEVQQAWVKARDTGGQAQGSATVACAAAAGVLLERMVPKEAGAEQGAAEAGHGGQALLD